MRKQNNWIAYTGFKLNMNVSRSIKRKEEGGKGSVRLKEQHEKNLGFLASSLSERERKLLRLNFI